MSIDRFPTHRRTGFAGLSKTLNPHNCAAPRVSFADREDHG